MLKVKVLKSINKKNGKETTRFFYRSLKSGTRLQTDFMEEKTEIDFLFDTKLNDADITKVLNRWSHKTVTGEKA